MVACGSNLAGVVQTRDGWIRETRLKVAGEDGSEGKKQSEKQKSPQQAQEPVPNYRLTFKWWTGKAWEDELELNTAEPEQLTRNRWETGSNKSAYHTQPAQLREMSTKTRQQNSKNKTDLHILTPFSCFTFLSGFKLAISV